MELERLPCYIVAQSVGVAMSENAVVRARIDERIKEEASAVLQAMGLTVSDAFRLMMTRIAAEKALPFEPLVPNAATIEAMKEARRGNLPRFESVEDLLAELNAPD
jgi:DNA-damage-inducible protein J